MRCIEMHLQNYLSSPLDLININMRCIEIKGAQASLEAFARLTLT